MCIRDRCEGEALRTDNSIVKVKSIFFDEGVDIARYDIVKYRYIVEQRCIQERVNSKMKIKVHIASLLLHLQVLMLSSQS